MLNQPRKRQRVWWLASYPKSGNTWVRAFLTAYMTGKVDINKMFFTINDLADYYHHIVSPESLSELSFEEMAMLHPAAMLHLAHLQPGPIFCKTHNINGNFYGNRLISPAITKGAVYIVRDPRDIVVSWSHHNGHPLDEVIDGLSDAGKGIEGNNRMPHVLSTWTAHVKSYLDEKEFPVLLVRYEDLVEDPAGKFAEIVKFVGLDFDSSRVQAAVDLTAFEKLQQQERDNGFQERMVGEFFNKGKVGTWFEALTQEQWDRIEKVQAEGMALLGYEPYRTQEKIAC